jgi:hypothetical protein
MKRKAESWYNEKERGSISAFQGDGVPPRRRQEGVINELNELSELRERERLSGEVRGVGAVQLNNSLNSFN